MSRTRKELLFRMRGALRSVRPKSWRNNVTVVEIRVDCSNILHWQIPANFLTGGMFHWQIPETRNFCHYVIKTIIITNRRLTGIPRGITMSPARTRTGKSIRARSVGAWLTYLGSRPPSLPPVHRHRQPPRPRPASPTGLSVHYLSVTVARQIRPQRCSQLSRCLTSDLATRSSGVPSPFTSYIRPDGRTGEVAALVSPALHRHL